MSLFASLDPARRVRRIRALRLWLCATLIGLLLAVAGVSETAFRTLRSMLREHPASGRVVVVGIDDKSLAALGQWPLPRSTYARLIDRLFANGAEKVYLTPAFVTPQSPAEDHALGRELAKHRGRVFLGTRFTEDDRTGSPMLQLPIPSIGRGIDVVVTSFPIEANGEAWKLPYAIELDGVRFSGLAASVANQPAGERPFFPIDTSTSLASIPNYSVSDVLEDRGDPGYLTGKIVIVGLTTDQIPDLNVVRPYGRTPNAIIQAVGAETLLSGTALDLGPAPLAVLASLMVFSIVTVRRPVLRIGLYVGGACVLFATAVLVPTRIWLAILPGSAIVLTALTWDVRTAFKEKLRIRGTTNEISGLLNLTALRHEVAPPNATLVVAQIHNFADAIATLSDRDEQNLVGQVSSRLKLGGTGLQLFHGDNGVFAWFSNDDREIMGDHLDGLYAMFRSPVVVDGSNIDLVVTFGTDFDDDRPTANRLGSALVAATEAQSDGAKWRAFDKAKLADAAWKLSLLSQLDAAIDDGDLWVAYQPKLDLNDRRIIGAEALVRWTHPEKGAISPIEFVAAAEQHNRIEKLTLHVLDRAVLAAATINAHGIPFGMAVNLSTRLLETREIVDAVVAALAAHGLPADKLTLEITETATLSTDTSLAVLGELRDLGVRISIDDYGTGLSTLDYLKRIPACEIKIDRSFVQSIMGGGSDLLMVNSTIQLAHSLGHVVVAEGVETDEVLARLADLQCDIAQGYRIGRPMTFQDLARRLLAERRRAA